MPLFEARNIAKSFDGKTVLKDISLNVEAGDVNVILGPSGSGKTTFLRTMNFLEKADSGVIGFNGEGRDVSRYQRRDILRLRRATGFVFQHYNLFPNRTALGNVTEVLTQAHGIPDKQAHDIAMEALEKVGMADHANQRPVELSGGEQQRVGIARAIAVKPKVIFFDEPTSALDPERVGDVLDIMKELAREQVTMIVVTHEMQFAREVASHVMFMDDGEVIEEGSAEQIFTDPRHERTQRFLERVIQHTPLTRTA
ncbi:amino acid ABC transporter ATP-binding protein [Bifidobacterium rousetti]|uniref:amino acid ABC transporter ATP-binding protein n=1 Tax=Bifidobacterium rousetti TaxID=2045439 RepID=UPI000D13F482|nr:amino acid ABC transporter ATP-binding protein [Bifidobacterium rousetti]KAA8819437.1 amino acid ABC transporter ATP-binding protein [Bifidobacterium rousetti]PST49014.1 amino acid ABC transporter ATP-binding protein [Bifidobacterium callitrichos]